MGDLEIPLPLWERVGRGGVGAGEYRTEAVERWQTGLLLMQGLSEKALLTRKNYYGDVCELNRLMGLNSGDRNLLVGTSLILFVLRESYLLRLMEDNMRTAIVTPQGMCGLMSRVSRF